MSVYLERSKRLNTSVFEEVETPGFLVCSTYSLNPHPRPSRCPVCFVPTLTLFCTANKPAGSFDTKKSKTLYQKRRLENRSAVLVPRDAAPALPEGLPYCGRPRVVHPDGEEHHDVLRLYRGHQVRRRGGAALYLQGMCFWVFRLSLSACVKA